jgi:repressor LexA
MPQNPAVDALADRHDLLIMDDLRTNAEPSHRRGRGEGPTGRGEVPTGRQRKIVQVIEAYFREHGCSPSNREIAKRAGLASTSSVSHHLRKLRAAGLVSYDDGHPRTVTVSPPVLQATRPVGQARRTSRGSRPRAGQPRRDTRQEKVAWVPVVGRIAAGTAILAQQSIEDYWPLPKEVVGPEEGLFMLRVAGDSMTGVGIFPGDLVVIRPLFEAPRNGDIVAATVNGIELEGTVKTYMKEGRRVWLMPHATGHLPISGDKAEFAGKVIAVLRQV